jgi:hypothetical protein
MNMEEKEAKKTVCCCDCGSLDIVSPHLPLDDKLKDFVAKHVIIEGRVEQSTTFFYEKWLADGGTGLDSHQFTELMSKTFCWGSGGFIGGNFRGIRLRDKITRQRPPKGALKDVSGKEHAHYVKDAVFDPTWTPVGKTESKKTSCPSCKKTIQWGITPDLLCCHHCETSYHARHKCSGKGYNELDIFGIPKFWLCYNCIKLEKAVNTATTEPQDAEDSKTAKILKKIAKKVSIFKKSFWVFTPIIYF